MIVSFVYLFCFVYKTEYKHLNEFLLLCDDYSIIYWSISMWKVQVCSIHFGCLFDWF